MSLLKPAPAIEGPEGRTERIVRYLPIAGNVPGESFETYSVGDGHYPYWNYDIIVDHKPVVTHRAFVSPEEAEHHYFSILGTHRPILKTLRQTKAYPSTYSSYTVDGLPPEFHATIGQLTEQSFVWTIHLPESKTGRSATLADAEWYCGEAIYGLMKGA